MDLVVVHWKIKPTREQAFIDYWKALTPDPNTFIAEYLSRPLSEDESGFWCQSLDRPEEAGYTSFFNVGLWPSVDAFNAEILKGNGGPPEKLEFEEELRR